MPKRSPHQIQPGEILEEDVSNLDGNLLFPADTVLSEKKIEILMMWGVESVTVKGAEDSQLPKAAPRPSDSARHDAEATIRHRFKLVKSTHPAVVSIRELAAMEAAKSSDYPTS